MQAEVNIEKCYTIRYEKKAKIRGHLSNDGD